MKALSIRLAALTLVWGAISAPAATLILQDGVSGYSGETGDYIRSTQATTNYSTVGSMLVGETTTASDYLRGLLSFDLSSIPTGAVITSVTLTLTGTQGEASTSTSSTVDLEQVTTTDNPSQTTWDKASSSTNWTTAGGDFSTLLSSATGDPATFTAGSTMVFASTTAFVDEVQTAVDDGTALQLLAKFDVESNAAKNLFSFGQNSLAGADAPILTIVYTVPEPGVISLLLGGGALLAWRRLRTMAGSVL